MEISAAREYFMAHQRGQAIHAARRRPWIINPLWAKGDISCPNRSAERLPNMPVEAGPDFLCVGMQKAGTGWLYDQLQHHPDFWMPPIKEIHYLHQEEPKIANAVAMLKHEKQAARGKVQRRNRRELEPRDMQFLTEIVRLAGHKRDFAKYASLFRFKDGKLSGDVTPGYSALEA